MTNALKHSITSRVHHRHPTWVAQPSKGKAILDQPIPEEPLPYTCHPSTDRRPLKTPCTLDWWVTSPVNFRGIAKLRFKTGLLCKHCICLFVLSICALGRSDCILSGLDLTMYTSSRIDRCIIGALFTNAFCT